MEQRDFIYWLNGFFELSKATTLDETQVEIIKDHLSLVMDKETPSRNPAAPVDKKEKSKRVLHSGGGSSLLVC